MTWHGHTGAIRHASVRHPSVRRRRPSRAAALIGLVAASAVLAAACTSIDPGTTAIDRTPTPPDTTEPPTTTDDPNPNWPGPPPAPTTTAPDDTTATDPTTPTMPEAAALDWAECDDDIDEALQCATLTVPLDYGDVDGDTIDIALVKLPAARQRQGAVLFNPGGPGGSGVDFVSAVATYAATEIGLGEFDLVGFDPRGVDRSNGLRCLDDDELDEMLFTWVDDADADADADAEAGAGAGADADTGSDDDQDGDVLSGEIDDERFADACRAAFGDSLQHFSTIDTARDMDLIRAALGDETISYIGISYGTYLGAMYATLFPERVRALVLDSGFEPTDDSIEEQYLTQLVGFEEAFDAWAQDCQDDPGCAFHSDDVAGAWDALRDEVDETPIAHTDGRAADLYVFETATISALYDQFTWPRLSMALADAVAGDPTGVFELADAYIGRSSDGTFNTIRQSNPIISCASGIGSAPPDDPEAMAELIRTTAPRWGRDVDADSFGDRCADLMAPVDLMTLSFTGDAPIVVIGGVNDPATPFRWSEEMAEALGPTAALVTWNGEGHGQMFGSTCLMDVARSVIVDLVRPPDGTVCDPDPAVERPAFWDTLPVPDGVSDEVLGPEALVLLGLPPTMAYSEVRTSTLGPSTLLATYADELTDLGFTALGQEEPIPGLILSSFFTGNFEVVSVLVLTDEAYEDDELAAAASLVDDGETLVALIYFPV